MSLSHRFSSGEDAKSFLYSGKAIISLRSSKTGKHFTYRVRQADDGQLHFVSLLTGDNEFGYTYLGIIKNGVYTRTGKSVISPTAPAAIAAQWAFGYLLRGVIPPDLEVWHEGRCGACGRLLTDPDSLESGIGPECGKRLGRGRAAMPKPRLLTMEDLLGEGAV